MRERDLQSSVARFLVHALPPDAIFHHSANEAYLGNEMVRLKNGKQIPARVLRAKRMKKDGMVSGWPDLEVIYDGRASFIELKSERGVLSDEQKEVHARLRNAGATVVTCRSLVEVEMALELFGIPLRAKVAA